MKGELFNSLIPFVIGVLLAINKINIEKTLPSLLVIFLFLLSIILGVVNCFKLIYIETLTFYLSWVPFLFFWYGYDYLNEKSFLINIIKSNLMFFTFFIYVFHEPFTNVAKKIILYIGKNNEVSTWLSYFLSPFIMMLISISVAKIISKHNPKIYSVLVGGRL